MSDKLFHLQPWTPRLAEVAEELIKKIHQATPELEVLFMGAAALGLPGKNDIDLDILCSKQSLANYTQKLVAVLGNPKETKDDSTAWEFNLHGFEIDCMLSDPTTSHVPLQRRRFEILSASPELQREYRQLKEECDGLPYVEYEKRKIAFFEEKVLSSNH